MFARADTLKVVSNAVRELVMLPGEWGEVYRWVIADENVPDKEEVLMLIRYHYGSFDRLAELLRYLNGGKAYTYLLQFVFPRIGRYTIKPSLRCRCRSGYCRWHILMPECLFRLC